MSNNEYSSKRINVFVDKELLERFDKLPHQGSCSAVLCSLLSEWVMKQEMKLFSTQHQLNRTEV